ncbi:23S rRNA (uracil(1939)-C(5))-methyltransferase RlmD [Prevotella bivia]|uniref:23S rRNA (Uracil-5-)-methyltransferase RumA n=1 Tax=Prevotella bivia TaxID=28125 RepID=A0A137SQC5_9BACT|nr:23S rRNA (uracil(1939)-C(5))-methyltransferase RlmD [Prevotella bivia]KXO14624.1 23S rRNA (uracil-5-)-methyltransferase RumA [Prevotella bivia]MDU2328896.1 23S rRNA (uracil(1939)-C(5))-methyltransferase RlmD [Prevotella bivia]MDU3908549.1 23S rRNA (uracil(1939)-C(5))-methyltransferase RlmD [Prevotella bivia]WIL19112.1 23S rRNA (uracil(1939)-C(5))-methyltransferase RlmD [Prevotella bivia]
MSRKRKPLPILENVTIEAVAAEGKCVAHVNDMVIFVSFVVPGDIVDLQVRKKRHSYCEATVVKFVKYSELRIKPMCDHFGICGGCKWQNLPYSEQLKAKQQQVFDQLTRIGKIELPEFSPIMGSVHTKAYRNKLEFGCANKRWYTAEELQDMPEGIGLTEGAIGFHITGAFDKIYPIEKCWLMDNLQNEIRNSIRNYALENNLTFFDLRQQHGLLRDIMVRNSNTGEWMVLIQFHYDVEGDEQRALGLMQHLADNFPQISSLLYVNNQKGNDTFNDLDLILFKGNDHIFETMEDLRFKVGPKSFYQTNTEQAYHLYDVARRFANLTGEELVYDLYTGTGTIANFVAKRAKKVIGIEYVPEAIEDAKVNSEINKIQNTLFYAGDMKDILTESFVQEHGRPDIIITDPPRAGMHPDVVNVILGAHPKRIVYVSCNPATQARDLALLDVDYKVVAVQPVDMFPHTPHVENVVLLEERLA